MRRQKLNSYLKTSYIVSSSAEGDRNSYVGILPRHIFQSAVTSVHGYTRRVVASYISPNPATGPNTCRSRIVGVRFHV